MIVMIQTRRRLNSSGWVLPLQGVFAVMILFIGCGRPAGEDILKNSIVRIDGSSTVYPLSEAIVEEFRRVEPDIRVTIGISGTGGGFKKFVRGETEISDASRPIKVKEARLARRNGVEFIELPIAFDGIVLAANPANDWCESLTLDQLRRIWEPAAQGRILNWNQVRADWPDEKIGLYGPGVDSGTYDYFTRVIVGEEGSSRGDFVSSEDDNTLVWGVAGDKYALGFFGYSYYKENKSRLKLIAVDDRETSNGSGGVYPTPATIGNGAYRPLSRPIFLYVRKDVAIIPAVESFVEFYLERAPFLALEVGFIPLHDSCYKLVLNRFRDGSTGSAFGGTGSLVRADIGSILSQDDD
jgi:phosphate transport system substrate-binding protein